MALAKRRSRLVLLLPLCLSVVAACGREEPPTAVSAGDASEGSEWPGLEPFRASRMWTFMSLDEMSLDQALYEVKRLRGPDHDSLLAEGLALPALPPIFSLLGRLRGRDDWSPAERELFLEIKSFLGERLGAPDGDLSALARWFREQTKRPETLGAMIFTMDDGPELGEPLPEGARLTLRAKRAVPGGLELQLLDMEGNSHSTVLRGVRDGRVEWSRVAGVPMEFGEGEPTPLGSYGHKLHMRSDGEYCHLYLGPAGEFLFYFVSW